MEQLRERPDVPDLSLGGPEARSQRLEKRLTEEPSSRPSAVSSSRTIARTKRRTCIAEEVELCHQSWRRGAGFELEPDLRSARINSNKHGESEAPSSTFERLNSISFVLSSSPGMYVFRRLAFFR